MILYCGSCDDNHALTAGEVERVVYALCGEAADAMTADDPALWAGESPWDHAPCLLDVLSGSRDIEQYAEFTDASVGARRSTATVAATKRYFGGAA